MSVNAKVIAVMRGVKSIEKSQRNQTQKFNYRGIDDLYNAIYPLMCEQGLCLLVLDEELIETEAVTTESTYNGQTKKKTTVGRVYKYCVSFVDEAGDKTEPEYFHGEGLDFGDKATSKCHQQALKYWMIRKFMLPTKEQDADGEGYERVSNEKGPKPSPELDIRTITKPASQISNAETFLNLSEKVAKAKGVKGPELMKQLGVKDWRNPTKAEYEVMKKLAFSMEDK